MEPGTLQKTLRIFYEYSIEYILYIQQGKIKGVIHKQDIVKMMSDLSVLSDLEKELPVIFIDSLEEILEIHHKYGISKDSTKLMPVVNAKNEYVGNWGRAEIIQAYENISDVKSWQPPKVTQEEKTKSQIHDLDFSLLSRLNLDKDPVKVKSSLESQKGEIISNSTFKPNIRLSSQLDTSYSKRKHISQKEDIKIKKDQQNNTNFSVHKSKENLTSLKPQLKQKVKENIHKKSVIKIHVKDSHSIRKEVKTTSSSLDKNINLNKAPQKQDINIAKENISVKTSSTKEQELKPQNSFETNKETFSNKTTNKQVEEYSPKQKWKQEIEMGRLAVLTLESLPLPMIAIDTAGKTIFYNQDWETKYSQRLDNRLLLEEAKKLMAKKAIAGTLEISDTFDLPNLLHRKLIRMRTMQAEVLNQDNLPVMKTIGYLFWIDNSKIALVDSNSRTEIENSSSPKQYLGSTLPEIIAEEEKKAIAWAMKESDNNITNAAMLLGIPRQTLSYKYHKLFD